MSSGIINSGARCSGKEVVVVTGASGLIGSGIINKISDHFRIVGFDRDAETLPPLQSEMIYVDITKQKSIDEAMARIRIGYGNKIASVIHLAAYYDFAGRPSPLYEKVTVRGTQKLLQGLRDFEVDQFIFSSSLLVYKPTVPGKKIDENSPLQPKWAYPESKVEAEKVILQERKNIPVVMLRIAGTYTDTGSSIPINNHIKRIYEKQITSHFFPGDVSHGNPYIHLDDLIGAMAKVIEKRKTLPEELVLNIGEEETLSFEYLQKTIGKLLHGKEWKTYRIPKFVAKFGAKVQDIFGDPFIKPWMIDMADDHMELDMTLAKKMLDWQPEHSLRETLPKMISSLRANPDHWYKINRLKK